MKTESKKVSATIEKYKAEYSKLKVEQEETTKNLMSSKAMWDEYSKRINKLESENTNIRSILCLGSNGQPLAFIEPQEMHKKIRYLESQLILWLVYKIYLLERVQDLQPKMNYHNTLCHSPSLQFSPVK